MEQRYCKFCGGMINSDKVCDSCGHKYFKIRINKKFKIAISLFVLICIISTFSYMGYTIYESQNIIAFKEEQIRNKSEEIETLKDKVAAENNNITAYKARVVEQSNTIKKLKTEHGTYLYYLNWYKENVALTTPSGDCYHTIDCPYIEDSDVIFVQHYIDALRAGYKACSYCEK